MREISTDEFQKLTMRRTVKTSLLTYDPDGELSIVYFNFYGSDLEIKWYKDKYYVLREENE